MTASALTIWISKIDAIQDKPIFFSSEEKRRIQSMLNKRARSFKAGRVLMKSALSESLGRSINDIDIEVSTSGKPFIKGKDIWLSLSHSGEYVAFASSQKAAIAIDIQEIRSSAYFDRIAKRVMSPTQFKALKRPEKFFRYWCLAEALTKLKDQPFWPKDFDTILPADLDSFAWGDIQANFFRFNKSYESVVVYESPTPLPVEIKRF